MKRRLPTVLILLVMVLAGAMYWADLLYHTDPETGFVTRGAVWMRYGVLLVPLLMSLLGLGTVGPRGISALRAKSRPLGVLFGIAAAVGVVYGGALLVTSVYPSVKGYGLVLGVLLLWYGGWMALAGHQLLTQKTTAPTQNALWGVPAALPWAVMAVYRALVNPSSVYRIGPMVRVLAALFALLWLALLLRSYYVAMPRRRTRWMYLCGVFTFLFATCLEPLYTVYGLLYSGASGWLDGLASLNGALLGLCAGCVSVAIAGQGRVKKQEARAWT